MGVPLHDAVRGVRVPASCNAAQGQKVKAQTREEEKGTLGCQEMSQCQKTDGMTAC